MIRWMIRRDMYEVLAIENECFERPWSEEIFVNNLQCRNVIGMVYEADDEILGYMVYALHKPSIELLNMAVSKTDQRTGIGAALVDKLKSKMSVIKHKTMWLHCLETNLPAQKFFASQGFKVSKIIQNHYDELPGVDAYRMTFSMVESAKFSPQHRFSKLRM